MTADAVLSGEFSVRPFDGDEGGYVAEFIGNDEADDIGNGGGNTPAEALEDALRDYLRLVGEPRAGTPAPVRRT